MHENDRLSDDDPEVLALAEALLAIGRDCAPRLAPVVREHEHGDLLYDEHGLPR